MSAYRVVLTATAAQQLARLDRPVMRRLQGAIELLQTTPYPPRATRLVGRDGYRVGVGDYRVLYVVKTDTVAIIDAVSCRQ